MTERKRRGRRGNGEGGIDLKPRSDGLWRARITLEDGSRKDLYGRTYADVEEKPRPPKAHSARKSSHVQRPRVPAMRHRGRCVSQSTVQ